MKTSLALFDFDGTITTRDTFMEIIKYQKGSFGFYGGMFLLSPILILYKLKVIENWKAKEMVLTFFFKGMAYADFQKRCDEFIVTALPSLIRPEALQKVRYHLTQHHRVVVVSASPYNWIEGWCKEMGVEVIASRLQIEDNIVTGKLDSKNCFGQEKVNRIKNYLSLEDYQEVYAYGDSSGDKPMLAIAHHAYFRRF